MVYGMRGAVLPDEKILPSTTNRTLPILLFLISFIFWYSSKDAAQVHFF